MASRAGGGGREALDQGACDRGLLALLRPLPAALEQREHAPLSPLGEVLALVAEGALPLLGRRPRVAQQDPLRLGRDLLPVLDERPGESSARLRRPWVVGGLRKLTSVFVN